MQYQLFTHLLTMAVQVTASYILFEVWNLHMLDRI